jgi:tRNA-specific 2-thiouridylase
VISKDMKKNEVYVTTDLNDKNLWARELNLTDIHWIDEPPEASKKYQVRTRHRAPLINCELSHNQNVTQVMLENEVRAATPGQSAVIYDGDKVLGGGILV